jgi:hypothetical protein
MLERCKHHLLISESIEAMSGGITMSRSKLSCGNGWFLAFPPPLL